MFGLFKPACPCDPAAKAWVEKRLSWLRGAFRSTVFSGGELILPTKSYFPDPFDRSPASVLALFHRVCGYMGVRADQVRLDFKHDPNRLWLVNAAGQYLPHAAGTYHRTLRKYVVTIDTEELLDVEPLIGTFAHELSHARLLGESRVRGDSFDDEMLTDLTALALGFGIFLANSPRVWESQYSKWPGTRLNCPKYMTPPMFGYALAHLAWFQGDAKPPWAKFLGAAVATDFAESTRYLFKIGESSFRPVPRLVDFLERDEQETGA